MARRDARAEERLVAGRYRIEALLGRGGMGAVYSALDTTHGKRIAIKCMVGSASEPALELFKREYHTLQGLRHPNIIEVYDYGRDADGPFYTMELLEGSDLGRAAPLPWQKVCSYLHQVATLLGLLHARRLLHRDITPRNLWILPDGRLKLIDFGALCPFGVPSEVVGTPPFIAPEWLHDRAAAISVDQRADLYALGALGYFLLTSAHAYPARSVSELKRVWLREPAAVSSLAKLVENPVLPPIPPELDALIASLLRHDPAGRPATTEILIDRLGTIAGPESEPVDHAVRGYVHSKAFVGRGTERALIAEYLRGRRGEVRVIAVEAAAGLGRSRLLEELLVLGRLAGATGVLVRGDAASLSYGVANAIALGLLDNLPSDALASARPYASLLAQLSPQLQSRLGVVGPVLRDATPSGREQLQNALTQWLLALAEQRQILLLVDDFERSDEESAAWLAALALGKRAPNLLLVAAVVQEPNARPPLHLQMFLNVARTLQLAPLTAAELHELLHSVFGPAPYLARVAETLHRVAQGSPAHCLELVDHLVGSGLAYYAEGTWTLPGQLSEEALPNSRSEMHAARLLRIGAHARSLAELLSIHAGHLTRAECQALSELNEHETAAALVDLTLCGVLVESEQGYSFAHASVRDALGSELEVARRTRAHKRLGAALLAGAVDPIDAMRAGLHLFRAGEARRCQLLVHAAVMHIFGGNRARMHVAVPLLEQAVELYRAAGCGLETQASPLAALAAGSYFADRRLADRYGLAAVDALEYVLRFDIAHRLRRVVGAKAALGAALAAASLASRVRRTHAPSIVEAMRMFLGAVVGLNAVATSGFDIQATVRFRHALEPLAVLGDRNVAGFIRRCTLSVSAMLGEDHAASIKELRYLAALMESGAPIRNLPDHLKRDFLGGCLFSIGIMECWQQNESALAIADRIEVFGPNHALSADHLRAVYYSGRGEPARAEHHRQCVETRALQVGAAWQVVTLAPIDAHLTSIWTQDALLAKHAAAELERLSRELPTLRSEAVRARVTYLVLCGRYREAIESMRVADLPRTLAGWSRSQGVLARAHNRLGEYSRARELCQAALAGLSEENLAFLVMTLHLQLELALAEAGLGNFVAARAQSDQLLERYGTNAGPLARGALHETRARVAQFEGDLATCRTHIEAMRGCYLPTQIPSLLELSDHLAGRLASAERGGEQETTGPAALFGDDEHLMTRLRLILTHTEATFEKRAQRSLQIALELSGAQDGFLFSSAAVSGAVHSGDRPPSSELVHWAQARLESADCEQTVLTLPGQIPTESGMLTLGDTTYCLVVLSAERDEGAAGLVLGFRGTTPRIPDEDVIAVLARHLVETEA